MKHELIIRGGTVIDGSGLPRRVADVAVDNGLITAVGEISELGEREIDATGLLVTPGFVDIHTHYDGQATWDEHMAPSAWHGVTSLVMGNCGVGFAPVHNADHNRLIELMEGVEDIPGAALDEGLTWEWNSFADYLDHLGQRRFDVDVAAQVPHGALRLHVMGERGARHEPATPDDIAEMAKLAVEGVAAGALGFSTSRTRNHKTSTGEHTPTLKAEEAELVGIAEALGVHGAGVLQLVSDFIDVDDEFGMLRRMVEQSGRPLSLTLVHAGAWPEQWKQLLAHLEAANAAGLKMTGQVAARPIGILMGLELTLNPFSANPVYREIADLPLAERLASLTDPGFRERLLTAAAAANRRLVNEFDRVFEMGDEPNYEPAPSECLDVRADALGVTAEELALDLMIGEGAGDGMLFLAFTGLADGNLDSTYTMLTHPNTVPGLSDGGAHVGTICDGSFPTTLLTHWGRDRDGAQIELEYIIKAQCHDTAATVGLQDRGVLAPGYRADINIIDFEGLTLHKPELAYDLPAGGRRLMQRATGYRHTFVAGVETYVDGEPTGALPGRLIRGAKPAPH